MRSLSWALAVAATLLGGEGAACRAAFITFDFEGQTATSPPANGALTALPITNSGLTITLTRESGSRFAIVNTTGLGLPASWGMRALDPFSDTGNTAFILNFSQPVTGARIDRGDFGQDTDTLLLQAFSGLNATGTQLASSSATLPGGGNAFSFLTVSANGNPINSLRFIGGSSDFPNSVSDDNWVVNTAPMVVPAPPAVVLAATGLLTVLGFGRCPHRPKRDRRQ